MSDREFADVLADRPYPGRVIVVARTAAGLACAYGATGRSEASRQRRIRLTSDGDFLVEPTVGDANDPLRHYRAVRRTDDHFVFSNGTQTDSVADRLAGGAPPSVALEQLEYEGDPPIYTPRITAVVDSQDQVWVAAAHRGSDRRASSDTIVTRVGALKTGDGVLLTTYSGPVAEPVTNRIPVSITVTAASHTDLAQQLWDYLDTERRVLLAGFQPQDHLADPYLYNAVD